MRAKLLVIFCCMVLLPACELLQTFKPFDQDFAAHSNQPLCVWKHSQDDNNCQIEYWLKFWADIENTPWSVRKKQIDELSVNDTNILKKVLLSQGKSTPYQARLRAQGWVESILPKLSPQMRQFILVALYQPSQDLLEMESALVTLSKINTHQLMSTEELQILINKQKSQIDQLLNIEASIIQSTEEVKQ